MVNKDQLRKTIGTRLRKIRSSLSFAQEKMAKHLGTGRPNYTRIEIGDTFPNHFMMHKLATMFDVSLDWLVCGKGPMLFSKKKSNLGKRGDKNSTLLAALEYPGNPDVEELLEFMEQIPLLHHEIMELFFRFKIVNKELIETVKNKQNME
jgi:transcriptional regulator with XRE-family HTH domain